MTEELLSPEEIELKALKYGREYCDCPIWSDYLRSDGRRFGEAKANQKRVNCWRCRVQFDKKFGRVNSGK
ncbi:hypothetical protein LCGC14_2107820 [marine sediment metagenome]|uniref:Uncharacterized protein n=1 Tax=marine sediment metagenome TaxID=412755 RepID=A0A0F9GL57_9ZZZZ